MLSRYMIERSGYEQRVEERNGRRNDEGNASQSNHEGKPSSPMSEGGSLEVLRSTQNFDECKLDGQIY